jgi:hypothetical protein
MEGPGTNPPRILRDVYTLKFMLYNPVTEERRETLGKLPPLSVTPTVRGGKETVQNSKIWRP